MKQWYLFYRGDALRREKLHQLGAELQSIENKNPIKLHVFEPAFKVGHVNKPSYGDILVYDQEYNPLVLIDKGGRSSLII